MSSWREDALCNNTDPDLYDLDWVEAKWGISDWRRQDEYAQQMCAGCPVVKACARDALELVDVSDYALTPDGSSGLCATEGVVRGGVALRGVKGSKHRGRKKLALLAGVDWKAMPASWARKALVCVVCCEPFSDRVVGGVYRKSSRVCLTCSDERVAV